jgi:hypothetical protein
MRIGLPEVMASSAKQVVNESPRADRLQSALEDRQLLPDDFRKKLEVYAVFSLGKDVKDAAVQEWVTVACERFAKQSSDFLDADTTSIFDICDRVAGVLGRHFEKAKKSAPVSKPLMTLLEDQPFSMGRFTTTPLEFSPQTYSPQSFSPSAHSPVLSRSSVSLSSSLSSIDFESMMRESLVWTPHAQRKTPMSDYLMAARDWSRVAQERLSKIGKGRLKPSALLPALRGSFVVGEEHGDICPKMMLMGGMRELARSGVKTLFLEGFDQKVLGRIETLKDYGKTKQDHVFFRRDKVFVENHAKPEDDPDIVHFQAIHGTAAGSEVAQQYSYDSLIRAALGEGIAVEGLETPFSMWDSVYDDDRILALNYGVSQRLSEHQGKYVALVGEAHVCDYSVTTELFDDVSTRVMTGIASSLGVPGILVKDTESVSQVFGSGKHDYKGGSQGTSKSLDYDFRIDFIRPVG